ncbi:MAG: hypothetical protein AB7I50_01705 [Vicinamibacterales bacterium]
MRNRNFVYSLEFLRDGRPLASVRVTPDFAPVIEAARWAALRHGVPPAEALMAPACVEPRWNETLGQPYASGLVASALIGDRREGSVDVPQRYFGDYARIATTSLVERGLAHTGESLAYLVAAYASSAPVEDARARAEGDLHTEELPADLDVGSASLERRIDGATWLGPRVEGDAPVVITRDVLNEALGLVERHVDVEAGGFLIGHVCRDTATGDIFIDVTDWLPARHTQSTLSTLTFTPETWCEARAALALRRRGEVFLGWIHTHPVTAICRAQGCSDAAQQQCPMARDYFSDHDRFLHKTMFPRAHGLALVINDWKGAPPSASLFGYRSGLIDLRGFHVA